MNTKMKTLFLLWIVCAVAVVRVGVAETRPNVLLIMVDDLRDYGGTFTREVVKTPNLDRLRARGTTFAGPGYVNCWPVGPKHNNVGRPDFAKLSPQDAATVIRLSCGQSPRQALCSVTFVDSPKPNVVYIMADDLGWRDISAHGGGVATPNIDRLFRQRQQARFAPLQEGHRDRSAWP